MSRYHEYKKKWDPELGRYVKKHIYGEGIMDFPKRLFSKVFGKTSKDMAKKAMEKAGNAALGKTGDYVGNMAGDKIIKMLQKGKTSTHEQQYNPGSKEDKVQQDYNRDLQILRIMNGGKLKMRKR